MKWLPLVLLVATSSAIATESSITRTVQHMNPTSIVTDENEVYPIDSVSDEALSLLNDAQLTRESVELTVDENASVLAVAKPKPKKMRNLRKEQRQAERRRARMIRAAHRGDCPGGSCRKPRGGRR